MHLYTFQRRGHDISLPHNPPEDYLYKYGPYYDIGKYIRWVYWVWAFQNLDDFDNDWFKPIEDSLEYNALWLLDVPPCQIKWCGINRQCDRVGSIDKWFFKDPREARLAGDIPQALIKRPVPVEWVVDNRQSAKISMSFSASRRRIL